MSRRQPESPEAKLAQKTVESYVSGKGLPGLEDVSQELKQKQAGVFVCLKKDGDLRGCIGTIQPAGENVAEEIRANAVSSATSDFRFPPVTPDELDRLTYSVDVLEKPEDIEGLEDLDPQTYGVIVRSQGRSGLLLPDLEGVDTPEEQVRIAMMKAGIQPGEPVRLQRFKVTRHE